jgi:hypothetical protein
MSRGTFAADGFGDESRDCRQWTKGLSARELYWRAAFLALRSAPCGTTQILSSLAEREYCCPTAAAPVSNFRVSQHPANRREFRRCQVQTIKGELDQAR